MSGIIKAVDDFFALFVDDEAGRFFFLHLPFWGFGVYVGWHVVEYIGLYLLWGAVVFCVTPYLIAQIFLRIQEEERLRYYETPWTAFRVSLIAYGISVAALIGIPGLYYGWVMQAVKSQSFSDAYWWVIVHWWRAFHFFNENPKLKDLQEFANSYVFTYLHWQVAFFGSAVVIAPILFYWLSADARAREALAIKEQRQAEQTAEKERQRDEARAREEEARVRLYEQRREAELAAEKEKQKKIQAKIQEVRGVDPWDSGFL